VTARVASISGSKTIASAPAADAGGRRRRRDDHDRQPLQLAADAAQHRHLGRAVEVADKDGELGGLGAEVDQLVDPVDEEQGRVVRRVPQRRLDPGTDLPRIRRQDHI
jgi:hypothetical protein